MNERRVWYIGKTADPAEAYDSAFYPVEKVAREHCRNLAANGHPGYQVHEGAVVLVADLAAARAEVEQEKRLRFETAERGADALEALAAARTEVERLKGAISKAMHELREDCISWAMEHLHAALDATPATEQGAAQPAQPDPDDDDGTEDFPEAKPSQ